LSLLIYLSRVLLQVSYGPWLQVKMGCGSGRIQ
jgi:hypothetical protein